jgi:hypothetical protein
MARYGKAGRGTARRGGAGKARQGAAWQGIAGEAGLGPVVCGVARQGRHGLKFERKRRLLCERLYCLF